MWIILSNSIGPLGSTSKFQIHRTFGKHVQTSNHRTSGKHVQTSIHRTSRKHVQNSNTIDLWEARPNFKSIGPLGSTSKFQIHQVLWKHEPGSRTFGPLKTWAKAQKTLGPLINMSQDPKSLGPLKTWARIQNLSSSENVCQSPKNPWSSKKREPRSKNPRSSENMSLGLEPLVLCKLVPKPKRP